MVLALVPLAIVVAGGFGEGLAIYALYSRSEPEWLRARSTVLVTTLFLVAIVVAGPLKDYWRTLVDIDKAVHP